MAMVVAGGGVDVSWYGYNDSDDGDDEQFHCLFYLFFLPERKPITLQKRFDALLTICYLFIL